MAVRGKLSGSVPILLILCAAFSLSAVHPQPQQPPSVPPPAKTPPPQVPPPVLPVAPQAPPLPPQPLRPTLSVVIIDPGHGGADAGARGANGVVESDIVLNYARALRDELQRQGFRVLVTRQGNENPSFDERSAIANAQHGDIFISLHVSTTGPVGTVRVYSLPSSLLASPASSEALMAERAGLVDWHTAQRPFVEQSRRLAELAQIQLAQRFRGSPEVPIYAPVRQLRTVAAPAFAVEVSSVSGASAGQLAQMGPELAQAVARAVTAFKPLYEAGAK